MAISDGVPCTAANLNAAFVSTGGDNTYTGTQKYNKEQLIAEISSPSTPASGYGAIFFKSDGELYIKNDGGTEFRVSNQNESIAYVTKTTTYTAASTDEFINCSASGGSWTLTLPTASGIAGKWYIIGRSDQTLANIVTVDGNGSETIGGSTTKKLATQGEMLHIVSDGTNWQIIKRYIPSEWVSFTPTGSWNTNVTYTGFWRRVGDSLDIDMRVECSGAPNVATLTFNIVSGLTIDTARAVSNSRGSGNVYIEDVSVQGYVGNPFIATSTSLGAGVIGTASTYAMTAAVTRTVPFTFGSSDFVLLSWHNLPITNWEG